MDFECFFIPVVQKDFRCFSDVPCATSTQMRAWASWNIVHIYAVGQGTPITVHSNYSNIDGRQQVTEDIHTHYGTFVPTIGTTSHVETASTYFSSCCHGCVSAMVHNNTGYAQLNRLTYSLSSSESSGSHESCTSKYHFGRRDLSNPSASCTIWITSS